MAVNQRFRVPSRNGEVLAVPEFAAIPKLIEENRRRLASSDVIIDGIPLGEFRALARSEILAQIDNPDAIDPSLAAAPLILAGHQPELSHPGVWVKNFVLNGLARRVGGIPLNLIVDNDILKSTSLHVPVFHTGVASSVHQESLAFDSFSGEVPYEDREVRDGELFRSFPDRARPLWQNWGYEPLLPRVWRNGRTIASAFTAARVECERAWGCRNHEIQVSRLSQTAAFGRFAKHILGDLPRFQQAYNDAVQNYRRVSHIRSQSHPAPELGKDEAPFWERKGASGQRQRATTSSSVRALRPRALTLTLFARLCLGDFFIHGIGGGKYDEVTDPIIRAYFGIEPPSFLVLSATLHLPLPTFPATVDSLKQAERRVRDMRWNPQRHIEPDQARNNTIQRLIAEKERLIRGEPSSRDHPVRREWFRSLRSITDHLRTYVQAQIPVTEHELKRIELESKANEVLHRRDYSWVLYPEATLRPFLARFLDLP
jgi:hypothetical protein